MIQRISDILAMIRFSHTVFAMPFALLAAVMAWNAPTPEGIDVRFSWRELLGIVLCMVFARSAAMAVNRLADRKIDAENPRTKTRHIPAGILSVGEVTLFTVACSIGFIASTLLFWPNWLPLALSVPVLLFLFGYSYTKRWTSLAHFWLGASLMMAPIAAWIAIRGAAILASPLDLLPAVTLGFAVLLWVAGFDIIYACQDAEFDRDAKLHSVPSTFGIAGALRIAAACHALMIGALALLPVVYPSLGLLYWIGVAAVAILLIYEHAIVRPDDLSRVNLAFFHVNTIVGIGLFIVTTLDLLLWK
ncbi:putative 4-hydroxybenzoate polyprenyltransferase [Blastopirellula sp. JC732]|uniref:4-hydroxybenzoate polyprenyltransferase n=1 Tax=Blastopirellula sediminis TaxID=2894196 RepID=A0A9X1SIM8_9BACT|nr:UbiA-like polyprenyltransferase [Blastopirellula sediminis]MCC9604917.1 putative 4-hydroxybenzoate polyprenyltransferase [Blastopirellula sediminis]MCC9631783.1 putative 4-hydroxybenzoate polyprenyltransferase [Blastopirellula sediminis]